MRRKNTEPSLDVNKQKEPRVKASVGINTVLSIAAIAAGSIVATGAKGENPEHVVESIVRKAAELIPFVDEDPNLHIKVTAEGHVLGPLPGLKISSWDEDANGKSKDSKTTTQTPSETKTTAISSLTLNRVEEQTDVHMVWARAFDQDPNAERLSYPPELNDALAQYIHLKALGLKNIEIFVQGFTSDEDDTSNATHDVSNPGFGVKSEKNIALANRRRNAVMQAFSRLIQEQTGDTVTFSLLPGEEVERPLLAESIIAIANDLHISPKELVQDYNRATARYLNAEQRKVLDELPDDRFVRVLFKGTLASETSQTDTIVAPGHSDEHITLGKDGKTTGEGGSLYIVGILVPVVGLSIRRKNKQSDEMQRTTVSLGEPFERTTVDPRQTVGTSRFGRVGAGRSLFGHSSMGRSLFGLSGKTSGQGARYATFSHRSVGSRRSVRSAEPIEPVEVIVPAVEVPVEVVERTEPLASGYVPRKSSKKPYLQRQVGQVSSPRPVQRIKQPREHNFGRNGAMGSHVGRMPRSSGGDRSSKRGPAK